MKNLYMFYIGGTVQGANIEVHDLQFYVAEKPEDAFPALAERWFGEQNLLHIDIITKINWADGFDVRLMTYPSELDRKLYFVNMGGYLPGEVYERHSFEFLVSKSAEDAKSRAKEKFLCDHILPHRDALVDVDDCIVIDELEGYYIHLSENDSGRSEPPLFQGYKAIGQNYTVYDPVSDALVDLPTSLPSDGGIGVKDGPLR